MSKMFGKKIISMVLSLMLVLSTFGGVSNTASAASTLSENFESANSLDSWTNSSPTSWIVSTKVMDNYTGVSTSVLSCSIVGGQSTTPNIKKTFSNITNRCEYYVSVYPENPANGSAAFIYLGNFFTLTLRGTNKTIDLPDLTTIGNYTVGKWLRFRFSIDPVSGVDIWLNDQLLYRNAAFTTAFTGFSYVAFGAYRNFSSTFCYDDINIFESVFTENFESANCLDSWTNSSPSSWTVTTPTMNNYFGNSTKVLRTSIVGGQATSPNISKSFGDSKGKTEVNLWVYPEAANNGSAANINLNGASTPLYTLTFRGTNRTIDTPSMATIANYTVGQWMNVKFIIDPGSGVQVWIDGVLKATNEPFQNAFTSLNKIAFGSYKNYSSTFCYDDVSVINLEQNNIQAIYYVSSSGNDNNSGTFTAPFKTIQKARDVVRTINSTMTGDIYVFIRGGAYTLNSTMEFNENDSAHNGYKIIYSNYANETPLVNGGTSVSGWSLYSGNIYKAKLSSPVETRQLFVNGVRATRARSTGKLNNVVHSFDHSVTHTDTGFTTTDTYLANLKNLTEVEMVFEDIWTNSRCNVNSVSVNGSVATVTMKTPGWGYIDNKGTTSATEPAFVENAFELLDSSGEWYLDRTGAVTNNANDAYTLYYWPRTGENMSTASVVIGTLEQLITVQGSSVNTPVYSLYFKGINFKYTTWNLPTTQGWYRDLQNNIVWEPGTNDPYEIAKAALTFKYARGIQIENCIFNCLGGTALNMLAGCQDNLTLSNTFDNISANGIQVGEYKAYQVSASENYYNQTNANLILRNNDIINNSLNNCGIDYRSSTAIAAAFPQGMTIAYNEIKNMPYSGIHIGWGWTVTDTSIAKNNIIRNNYLYNTMNTLTDGAAIYVLGPQGSSTEKSYISNNYININGDHALYFDNGSCWWNADSNVFDNIVNVNINISTSDKHDITVTNWYADDSSYWNQGTNTTVSTPTLKSGGVWPTGAQTIINSTGLIS